MILFPECPQSVSSPWCAWCASRHRRKAGTDNRVTSRPTVSV